MELAQFLHAQDLLGEAVAVARQRALDAVDAQQVHADAGDGARLRGGRTGGVAAAGSEAASDMGMSAAAGSGTGRRAGLAATDQRPRSASSAPAPSAPSCRAPPFPSRRTPPAPRWRGRCSPAIPSTAATGPHCRSAVARIHAQSVAQALGHRHADARQSGRGLVLRFGIGAVCSSTTRAGLGGGRDLRRLGIDEQRHRMPDSASRPTASVTAASAGHFQAALGGQLGAFFGHRRRRWA